MFQIEKAATIADTTNIATNKRYSAIKLLNWSLIYYEHDNIICLKFK